MKREIFALILIGFGVFIALFNHFFIPDPWDSVVSVVVGSMLATVYVAVRHEYRRIVEFRSIATTAWERMRPFHEIERGGFHTDQWLDRWTYYVLWRQKKPFVFCVRFDW